MMVSVARLMTVLAIVAGVAMARPALAQKADAREVKARELFGIGRYPEALEIYGKLYAETTHPTYMRNIGRCYQNMGEPDKAISSFREYLRQAANLAPDQRAQVEGYIREMEELKRQREMAHPPPPVAPPPVAVSPAPPGGAATVPGPTPPAAVAPPPLVGVTAPDASTAAPSSQGNSRRVAGLVVGGATVAALAVGGVFGARAFSKRHASDDECKLIVDGMERCSPKGVSLNEEAKTAARLSDVAFGVGLVGAAVSTYLLLTSRGDATTTSPGTTAPQVHVSPALGSGGASVALGLSW